jgi:ABC-type multidrug transport system ATPase subunit
VSAVIRATGLQKSYAGVRVVDGLDLSIHKGECFGLLGPNGAGKTTTLRMLLGLIEPDAGTATLLDLPVPQAAREARIRVGVVPQMDNLDPDFTVAENLLVYGRYFGMQDSEIDARIPSLLEFASLSNKRDDAGSRAGERSRCDLSRRTDHRTRSTGAPPDLAAPARIDPAGQNAAAYYALYGRSRAPVSSPRGPG